MLCILSSLSSVSGDKTCAGYVHAFNMYKEQATVCGLCQLNVNVNRARIHVR